MNSRNMSTTSLKTREANTGTYDLTHVKAPVLRGFALRLMTALLERPVLAVLLAPLLTRGLGIEEFRAVQIADPPTFQPLYFSEANTLTPDQTTDDVPHLVRREGGFRFRTIRDFQSAYQNGAITPEQVAERVLAAIEDSDRGTPPLRAFISCNPEDVLRQAHESARRHKEGRTSGPLDGVPVAIKDEVDMVPYPTTAGTRFLGSSPAQTDSTVAARLRGAGAMLIGKTNMHEIGILPESVNPHHGAVRNPYNLQHEAGGSSSGSAAAVAAGLCPAAIGADGGGSIRIPAAFCGAVGLMPTFGRVSEFGAVPLCASVDYLGPIAATAEDAALVYAVIAGRDVADPNTQAQPAVRMANFDGTLKGVRIGTYQPWFTDANAEVVAACERVLQELVRMGAELVDVVIPELLLVRVAHGLTIHAEMAANMDRYDRQHRSDFSVRTRLMLANVRSMRSTDYLKAQQIRTRAIRHFLSALSGADVIATPTTSITAPAIEQRDLPDGKSDVSQVIEVMRFVNPANLAGLPAITVPAGYVGEGMPIGLQLIARPWEEDLLLRLAYAVDGVVERRKPMLCFDLLPELSRA
jgi:Asp-tRNA(Asn)/Glu-tRNA(Gln) amidotransferase A subunit family amidase